MSYLQIFREILNVFGTYHKVLLLSTAFTTYCTYVILHYYYLLYFITRFNLFLLPLEFMLLAFCTANFYDGK